MTISVKSSGMAYSILVTITLVVYRGVFENGFVDFDDNVYVTENSLTKTGLSINGFRYAWTTFDSGNWIPVTWMSYQLDATLFGQRAWGYHGTNLGLHCANVVLLFAWLVRLTKSRSKSLIVAILFAVHPLHVESVAWIAERKDVLSSFWMLVALIAYDQYRIRPALLWYLITFLAFAMGLLSKSMLVTFPLLLVLVDCCFPNDEIQVDQADLVARQRSRRRFLWMIVEKFPFLVLSLADGIVTIIAQQAGQAGNGQTAGSALGHLPWSIRCGNALVGYCWYLEKTCWPTGLSVLYPHPTNQLNTGRVVLAAAVLFVISSYVTIFGRRQPDLRFGWLWFLISLTPVIGLIQVGSQAYADRYSYIPQMGLLLLLVGEVQRWLHPFRHRRILEIVGTSLTVAIWGWMTSAQVAVWRNTDTLWAQALKVDPDNWFAHLQVGNRRVMQALADDIALRHFQIVLKHKPDHAIALNNVGWIYQSRQDFETAEVFYRRSLAADPRFSLAMHNYMSIVKKQGRLSEIVPMIEQYAKVRSDDGWVQMELGMVAVRQGDFERARSRFEQSLRADPHDRDARNNLALSLAQLGRDDEARLQFESIVQRYPNDANARVNLGALLQRMGHLTDARVHFIQALKSNPRDVDAAERLRQIDKLISPP